ncbi:MAG: DUF1592 domain-containing protein [Verrucomicrobia bacterium]|nr:DUF1592 domain-containing protein [Verrucomicrobiota bacterium]
MKHSLHFLLMATLSVVGLAGEPDLMERFDRDVRPFLKTYCQPCHNAEKMKSGVRVDHLDGMLKEAQLKLWEHIQELVDQGDMPPEESKQPSDQERALIQGWIEEGLHLARTRDVATHGTVRRLTVPQYQHALRDLLGMDENFTQRLPPDAVSEDGFRNRQDTMLLSPLLLETYFEVAEMMLDRCIVNEHEKPLIQNFQMKLGKGVNPDPLKETLILGASSVLLDNSDFVVTEHVPRKPFDFEPFRMQKQFRFVEGYQGNNTVRGWREYNSIYHAVFACMRGSQGYPSGRAFDLVPEGLLLRPAIPSAELFQVESTYGPKANFKVSLRELPDDGRFRITVSAAKYDDGILLGSDTHVIGSGIVVSDLSHGSKTVRVDAAGVYQVEVHRSPPVESLVPKDDTRLDIALAGHWAMDDQGGDSPFGQALSLDGPDNTLVIPANENLRVGQGSFTVSAWIFPEKLQQGGMVAMGRYGRRGWVFDMPNDRGVLRLETFRDYQKPSGTVRSKAGILRAGQWQHVAAVVERGAQGTRLYVNGYEVASGNIQDVDLDDPASDLHIGRVPEANLFDGAIDEVRLHRRALDVSEIQALVAPGMAWIQPPEDGRHPIALRLGDRHFTGVLDKHPLMAVRLAKGPLEVEVQYGGTWPVDRITLAPVDNVKPFERFERQAPMLGVYLGLRRDCGSTLDPVGVPQAVVDSELRKFIFEGSMANFPNPDVEWNNVNYIAGLREIGVRSEYTDGRPRSRLLIESVEFEGPFYEDWPPKTHQRIFHSQDPSEVIHQFAERAFRRPLSNAEGIFLMGVYEDAFGRTGDFQESVRDTLLVILTSPQFLFIIEESKGPEAEELTPHELAAKLSFFLWNAPPDARLLALASEGRIAGMLDSELERMIRDARFLQCMHPFVSQWLRLDKLDTVETDRNRFPSLTRDTKSQLREEPVHFMTHLIRQNLPLRYLVHSDFIMANEVVAHYYGLGPQVESGFQYRPIQHHDSHLGGLLTQAGILAGLSNGRDANPIKRGAWFARAIIAEPPADPPPNVPALPEDNKDLPLSAQLERHRNQEGCAKCHRGIDPWGLPFEGYDAGGRWIHQPSVDTTSTLPDQTLVSDLGALKGYLVENRMDQLAFGFLKHLATYATGRSLRYNEVEFLRQYALSLEHTDYPLQDLLRFVVHSDIFLRK